MDGDFTKVFGSRKNRAAAPPGHVDDNYSVDMPPVALPQPPPIRTSLMQMPEDVPETKEPEVPIDAAAAADSNHQKLANLRAKALDVLGETMDVPTPTADDDDYARVLAIKKDAAVNVVNASLKADENCFRQRRTDALDRLFTNMNRLLEARAAKEAPTIDNVVSQGNA